MSFTARSFLFDGVPCERYGLMLYDLDGHAQDGGDLGTSLRILENRAARNYYGYHQGTVMNDPLEFKLVFGIDGGRERLSRFELAAVAGWLTGHRQYKWLQICQGDMELFRYKCLITELKSIPVGGLPVAFEATVRCDSPYAYHVPYTDVIECRGGDTAYLYRCKTTLNGWYYPDMKLESSGGVMTVANAQDPGRRLTVSGPGSAPWTVTIDGRRMTAAAPDGAAVTDWTNFQFLRALQGDNPLTLTGNGAITIYSQPPVSIGF